MTNGRPAWYDNASRKGNQMTYLEYLRGLTPLLFPCDTCGMPMAAAGVGKICDLCLDDIDDMMCDCGRGPIVGGPVPVCLECELGPFGRAWEEEMMERGIL